MTRIDTDICIIGAGSGGLSVAAGAVQMGARVVLIEAGAMGGDCLNAGCVPSKALLHAAASGMGWEAAHDHVRATIAAIAPHDSVERFEALGVTVLKGFARFTGPRAVTVEGTTVRARRIVIATGSRPRLPDVPGLTETPHLTNETIFDLVERPDHLLILGGGPIGMEMAQAHRRLGCDVTVIEPFRALGRDDPEAVAHVTASLKAEGVAIEEGAVPVRVGRSDHGIEIVLDDGRTLAGSHLLVATGRVATIDGLDLDKAGVETTQAGVKVDDRLRSTNRRVYAIGDVAGGMQFTHVAGYHAGVIVRSMLFGLPAKARTEHIPRVTYTAPELAQVGLTEAEARAAHGAALEVVRADFAGNDRAVATRRTEGFLKVMVCKGRPVGATLVGPEAGEHIALWALALSARLKMSAIAGMVAPYPTMGEISKRAAGTYFSPRLFDNPNVKRLVRAVQRFVP
ncbi:NAD(P)/FAD-dependent oxidoreductase [Maritimibacter sp. HL-12]|uniref:dihydrolipoyl dehydrogenase family protein n=1 Tax=Maritimibacter sp. HL-12 TaxID=1162418 RepID=UPI000A0F289A|nr:NAD(P)/FAD-dependent oxidoreductase [Maritimibacter sp. HL-12]SMH49752.1 Pyruvate/2-oxoglutarate dehydrogenase complex, dihydrolipoamide dehydrogenase (E3) component [Maritimibacter sp. HL-12]